MILQDPQTSLNPVFSIGNQLIEASGITIGKRAISRWCGGQSRPSSKCVWRHLSVACKDYPHQMSGGMKQRGGRHLDFLRARVIIADEPTTSLDVTIQAQYLRLLQEIQENTGLSLIFITHDFGIVAKMCDRVIVMYAGRVVERAGAGDFQ